YGGAVERQRAEACVAKAFELGIDFIDTANVYSGGGAEEFLGEVLADRPRDSYVLATKLYFPMSDSDRGLSREQVSKQIDASLRRLRTDHVDLYQCHRYDWDVPLAETMDALSDVVRQGKARYLGFSEWPEEKIREAQAMDGVEHFVSSQPQYSMIWRGPERDVIPASRELGISQIVYSPLAQGVLSGKYRPGAEIGKETRASERDASIWEYLDDDVLERVQRLRPIADGIGLTMAELALAWVLREPNVASAIVGASRPEQIRDNAAASGVELDDETVRAVEAALAPV